MVKKRDETELESHFKFGANWESYSKLIDDERLDEAVSGIIKLVGADGLRNRSFLDIGCGSGLHALAAQQLGAQHVRMVDIDPVSVSTATALFEARAAINNWCAEVTSVFELGEDSSTYDVVYSWGVLHHTGDLSRALSTAAGLVAPGGLLVVALYRPTRTDWLWTREKRWYSSASTSNQRRARWAYRRLVGLGLAVRGRRLKSYVDGYASARGMEFDHDAHDWLGGYPYETMDRSGASAVLSPLGFRLERAFDRPRRTTGILGSGCDEFVFRRQR